MNKNNINFQVHRTKEGTICEIVSGLLVLISLIISLVMLAGNPEGAAAMLIQTVSIGFAIALTGLSSDQFQHPRRFASRTVRHDHPLLPLRISPDGPYVARHHP